MSVLPENSNDVVGACAGVGGVGLVEKIGSCRYCSIEELVLNSVTYASQKRWEPEMHNKHHLLRETHPWTDGRRKPTSFQIATYKASLIAEAMNSAKLIEYPLQESFGFNELRVANRNFRPDSLLRESGFNCVFKGWIDENTSTVARPGTGMVISVKRLRQEGYQGHKEWALSHPNLVKLVGYCLEDEHRLLVYEFMPRGSLENHLFRSVFIMLGAGSSDFQPLSWNLRIKVFLGAAKGLAYLHSPEAKVIYLDSKVSNILIDSFPYNFHPFTTRTIMHSFLILGLAKDEPADGKSHVSTRVMGTYGYAALSFWPQ
ncbi:hypothetical protein RJ640_011634, partial [Escallonia rubra]